jgi:hypothetical protein
VKKKPPVGAKTSLALAGLAVASVLWTWREGEWETCMLPPGRAPEGEGWTPMRAVEHTSIYGGLKGRPQARVVWKRRRPLEDFSPTADFPPPFRFGLFR